MAREKLRELKRLLASRPVGIRSLILAAVAVIALLWIVFVAERSRTAALAASVVVLAVVVLNILSVIADRRQAQRIASVERLLRPAGQKPALRESRGRHSTQGRRVILARRTLGILRGPLPFLQLILWCVGVGAATSYAFLTLERTAFSTVVLMAATLFVVSGAVLSVAVRAQRGHNLRKLETLARDLSPQNPAHPALPQLGASGGEVLRERQGLSADLVGDLRSDPTPENLYRVLSHLWCSEGAIRRPAALIDEYMSLVPGLSEAGQQLVRQITSMAEMVDQPLTVPARGPGSMYIPRPKQVLSVVDEDDSLDGCDRAARSDEMPKLLARADFGVSVVVVPSDSDYASAADSLLRERLEIFRDDLSFVRLPGPGVRYLSKSAYLQTIASALVDEALRRQPEYVHAVSDHLLGLAALIAARRVGIPFVYEARDLWGAAITSERTSWVKTERFNAELRLEVLVASHADAVVVRNERLASAYVEHGVEPAKISVVAIPFDPTELEPLPKYRGHGAVVPVESSDVVLGYLGAIAEDEGLDILVEAVEVLIQRGTPVKCVIGGTGPIESALRATIADRGLSTFIEMPGAVAYADRARFLAGVDIMVYPRISSVVTETAGAMGPIEAFAGGRPAVLSNITPHRVLVGSPISRAKLFQPGEAMDLAGVLADLIAHPDTRRDLVRRARLWINDEYASSSLGPSIASAYDAALRHNATASDVGHSAPRIGIIALDGAIPTPAQSEQFVVIEGGAELGADALLYGSIDALVVKASAIVGHGLERWRMNLIECERRDLATVFWDDLEGGDTYPAIREVALTARHVVVADESRMNMYLREAGVFGTSVSSMAYVVDPTLTNPVVEALAPRSGFASNTSPLSGRGLDVARAHGLTLYGRGSSAPTFIAARLRSLYTPLVEEIGLEQVLASHVAALLGGGSKFVPGVQARGGVVIGPEDFANCDDLDVKLNKLGDAKARLAARWSGIRQSLVGRSEGEQLVAALRSAGVGVAHEPLPSFALILDAHQDVSDVLHALPLQTYMPTEVVLSPGTEVSDTAIQEAQNLGISLICAPARPTTSWQAPFISDIPSTFYEDLMICTRMGAIEKVVMADDPESTSPIVRASSRSSTVLLSQVEGRGLNPNGEVLAVNPAPAPPAATTAHGSRTTDIAPAQVTRPQRLLVAGHDLKFIAPIIDRLSSEEFSVVQDLWASQRTHDIEASLRHLESADVVLCEWGLGNAVWYSRNVNLHQRLIIRIHSQELRTGYLRQIYVDAVDVFVFVSELVRRAAIDLHGIPEQKTVVIPNAVDTERLNLPKRPGASRTMGLVGSVPQSKRLDLALDVLEATRRHDPQFRLVVKGRRPEEYSWMARRAGERAWYRQQYERIESINKESPGAVEVQSFGEDLTDWYRDVGVVLSVSDFESFHYTIADGVASGAVPGVLYWPGAEHHYPREWLSASVEDLVTRVISASPLESNRDHIRQLFGIDHVVRELRSVLRGRGWNH